MVMREIKPLNLINSLRESDQNIEYLFMMGSCYKFHLFLKNIFEDCIPFLHVDRDHVVSKIGAKMYDIKGEIKKEHECLYAPLKDEDLDMVKKWSFNNQMILSLGECTNCEEPILVNY